MDIQALIDVAQSNTEVIVPAGIHDLPPQGLLINKEMRLRGAGIPGRNGVSGGTALRQRDPLGYGINIATPRGNVAIFDMMIRGTRNPESTSSAAEGDGIRVQSNQSHVRLDGLLVWGFGRDGLIAGPRVNSLVIQDTDVVANGRHGFNLQGIVHPVFFGGYSSSNGECGLRLFQVDMIDTWGLYLEANQRLGIEPELDPSLLVQGGFGNTFHAVTIENFAQYAGSKIAVTLWNTLGASFSGCRFVNDTLVVGSRGFVMRNGTRDCFVGLNTWSRTERKYDLDLSSRVGLTLLRQADRNI